MIDKDMLLVHVEFLLASANSRATEQGVKIYGETLKKIAEASSQRDVDAFAEKLRHALIGIEAHGYFTDEEFDVVKAIRAMK